MMRKDYEKGGFGFLCHTFRELLVRLQRNLFKLIFLLLIYLGIIACRQMFIKDGIKITCKQSVLNKFTYALSEYTDVKDKKFIANPGCYATATELALIPLVASGLIETDSVIVDAKSGLTGAGKALSESSHFVNVHDNYVTYKLNHHQHIPEIVQSLQNFNPEMPEIQFSTSLLPVNRGIMATVYCKLKKDVTVADVAQHSQRLIAINPLYVFKTAARTTQRYRIEFYRYWICL